ncbi:SHOCT domain-containing protein [Clostridium sp. Mt-5]|uniref:SHOCT domain-containing protein n=2 Tax=Clostridium moutaii TaxID=3240932 RepID=A0ABV4BSL4_9CLOT
MSYYGYGMMGRGWGWFMMIGVIILMILGIIALVRYLQQSGKPNDRAVENNALNILNERYARGEITEKEYNSKKAQIKS